MHHDAATIRSRSKRNLWLAIACGFLPAVAAAGAERSADDNAFAELSLEELMEVRVEHVYGASRYEQKVTRAPASVTIVTAEEIARYGHRTLADVLRSVRSLYVSNDRNYSYLGVRGFLRPGDYSTRVLVLIDGHRINDNLFDSGTVAREGMIEVELIDRVEVIRGPGSSMYGSSAFFGVINIITKKGVDIDGLELGADAGSHDSLRTRAVYGEKLANGVQLMLSGAHYSSAGAERLYYPEFDQRISDNPAAAHDGVARGLDDEDAWNVYAKASYGEFTLSALHIDRAKNVPTASFGAEFGEHEWTRDYRSYVDLRYEHRFNDDLAIRGNVFLDEYRYKGNYPYDYAEDGEEPYLVDFQDGSVGRWAGAEWQLSARVRDRHTVLFGAEYRNNFREYQYGYDEGDPRVYTLVDDRSSSTLGMFAQGEFELTPDVVLIGGARYDQYYNTFGGHLSPRAGLIYSPSATSVVKALYGHAFRAPNPYELYYYDEQRLRPTLKPEQIDTYELVYERYLSRALRMSISAYHYEVEDLLSYHVSEEGEYYYDNLAHTRARGVELELAATLPSGMTSTASYTLQRSMDVLSEVDLSSSPRHMAKLSVSAPVWRDQLTAGLELQYQSEARTLSGGAADAFLITNLSVTSRALWKGLDLSFTMYNAFDEDHGYPGSTDHAQDVVGLDGRTFRGSLTYRF